MVAVPEGAPTTGIGTPTEPGAGDVWSDDAGITAAVKTRLLADADVSGLRIDLASHRRDKRGFERRVPKAKSERLRLGRDDALSGQQCVCHLANQ